MRMEKKEKHKCIAWQRFDLDWWVITSMQPKSPFSKYFGELPAYTKQGIEARGYKIGKKYKIQPYSDFTKYHLS